MANSTGQLDATIEVVTPENIAFSYRAAGPMRRLVAFAIDFAIRAGLLFLILMVIALGLGLAGLPGIGQGAFYIGFFVLAWFYGGLMETYWNGQTVGKRAMGMRVLATDGRPINGMQAVMRNVFREADSLPLFIIFSDVDAGQMIPVPTYVLALVAMMVTTRYQRLGDLACGTMVVMEERSWAAGLVKIDDPLVIRLAGELPAGLEFSRPLREALSAYIERRRFFPPGRRSDIARHLGQPLCRRFGLPANTNHDLLMCALYYRAFIADQDLDQGTAQDGIWKAPVSSGPPVPVLAGAIAGGANETMPVIQTKDSSLRYGGR
ncbi:MAG: RDD family protein [Planctomycetes bacterium]|nr:RDD family protein [Planctomycetota bacterium]